MTTAATRTSQKWLGWCSQTTSSSRSRRQHQEPDQWQRQRHQRRPRHAPEPSRVVGLLAMRGRIACGLHAPAHARAERPFPERVPGPSHLARRQPRMRPPAEPDAPPFPGARLILMSGGAAIGRIAVGPPLARPPWSRSGVGLVTGPTWGGIVLILARGRRADRRRPEGRRVPGRRPRGYRRRLPDRAVPRDAGIAIQVAGRQLGPHGRLAAPAGRDACDVPLVQAGLHHRSGERRGHAQADGVAGDVYRAFGA